jgi:enoyl-[acyl-carrier protein] reductase I
MIEAGKTYVVMGLLDSDSIAYAIGRALQAGGARVIYTAQNERMKSIFFDRADRKVEAAEKAALDIRFCDITVDEQIRALFASTGPIAGVVHSIAYANPRTCLGEEFHTDAVNDVLLSYHISAVSLARVLRYAQPAMPGGGSVVALTFDTSRVYPYYNWMGVHKAALEAVVRGLARRHGRDRVRVNAISAGPLFSKAASKIPGFGKLDAIWQTSSPIPWDAEADKQEVANAAAFLLGSYSRKITGQVLYVDGGAAIVTGELQPFERPGGPAAAASDRGA